MTASVREIEARALELLPEERAELAGRLIASLTAKSAVDDAWSTESLRRLAELEAGEVIAVPVEDAIARARAAIR